jgi:polysaccharide pyruvyl transferase WcaK-like protein
MTGVLAEVLVDLTRSGVRVALLPHATDTGIRKNDDMSVVLELQQAARKLGAELPVLDPRGDPRFARALIAQSTVFLASRFHSMIAALSQGVPVITVGWSHKYAEAAEPFGMEQYTLNYSQLTAANICEKIGDALSDQLSLRTNMHSAATEARLSAVEGIKIVLHSGTRS